MKRNFTLTELLVVIAIIGVLAGMTMPALSYARAAGQRTNCINNKSTIMKMMQVYANNNGDMIPYKLDGASYAYVMVGGANRTYSREYLPGNILTCTVSNVAYNDANNDTNNAIGMLNVNGDTWSGNWKSASGSSAPTIRQKFGRFISRADNNNIGYVLGRMKNTSILPLFADSYLLVDDSNPTPTPNWNFMLWDAPSNRNTGYAATVHGSQTTVAFADGRASSLSAGVIGDECGLRYTLNAELDTVGDAF